MSTSQILQIIQSEFSDLNDFSDLTRICIRLLMAVILGAIIGYERESSGAAAGLRTHMLVALGSALFILVPYNVGMSLSDMSRVLQGLTAGVGFLGAGTIIKLQDQQDIKGLTTAASLWLAAAVGVAAGMGQEATAILCTLFAVIILSLLRLTKTK